MPIPMPLPHKGSGRAWGTARHGFYDSAEGTIDTDNGELAANGVEGAIQSGDCFKLTVPGAPGAGTETPENGKLLDYARIYKNAANQLAYAGVAFPAASWLYVARGVTGNNAPEIWLATLKASGFWQGTVQLRRFGVFFSGATSEDDPFLYDVPLEGDWEYDYPNFRIDDISEDGSTVTFATAGYIAQVSNGVQTARYQVSRAFSIKLSGSGYAIRARAGKIDPSRQAVSELTFLIPQTIHNEYYGAKVNRLDHSVVPIFHESDVPYTLIFSRDNEKYLQAPWKFAIDAWNQWANGRTLDEVFLVLLSFIPQADIAEGMVSLYYTTFEYLAILSYTSYYAIGLTTESAENALIFATLEREEEDHVLAKWPDTLEEFDIYGTLVLINPMGNHDFPTYSVVELTDTNSYGLFIGDTVKQEAIVVLQRVYSHVAFYTYPVPGNPGDRVDESSNKYFLDDEELPSGFNPIILPFRANNNAYGYVKRTPSGLYARAFSKNLTHDTGWHKLSRDSTDPRTILDYAIAAFAANPDTGEPEFVDHACCYV